MRKMGIDYGTKRIAIAFSDDAGLMAFRDCVIENTDTAFKKIVALAEEKTGGGDHHWPLAREGRSAQ